MTKTFAKIQLFSVIALFSAALFSCDPNEKLPEETILEFIDYQLYGNDSAVTGINLQLSFQKGDGSLLGDNTSEKHLFVHLFDVLPDTTVPMQIVSNEGKDTTDVVYSYHIQVLSTDKSSIKGTFDIRIIDDFPYILARSQQGIIFFEVYLYDRYFVKSNTVTTPDIRIR